MWWSVTNGSCTQPINIINMHFFNSSVLNIKNELYLYQLVSVHFTDTLKLLKSISYCNTNLHLVILCVCVCKSYMAEIMKIHTHPLDFLSVYMLEKIKLQSAWIILMLQRLASCYSQSVSPCFDCNFPMLIPLME